MQGAARRHWEDVAVGDSLGTMAKGPLTVTDVMVFHAGGYGFVPYAPSVGRMAWRNRQRIPAFYVKNEFGIPDVAQRLHWDPLWAQAIGNPMAYDYGVMRENYVYHYLTDWAGDDGLVLRQHDEVRKFNYVGDTTLITGEVVAKRERRGVGSSMWRCAAPTSATRKPCAQRRRSRCPARPAGPCCSPTCRRSSRKKGRR